MASGSSNNINLISAVSRPSEARSNREMSQDAVANFDTQLKRELGKVQPKSAETHVAKKSESKSDSAPKSESVREKQSDSEPVRDNTPQVAKNAESTAAQAETDDAAAKSSSGTEANLAALLGMMHLAQQTTSLADKAGLASQQITDTSTDPKVGLGLMDGLTQGADGAQTEAFENALSSQNDKNKQNPALIKLDSAADSAANIAVDEMSQVANLPLDVKNALNHHDESFADNLAGRLSGHIQLQATPTSSLSTTGASSQSAAVPSHHLDIPVQDARWSDALAQRVSLMLGKQEQQIEMQLNPPNLGPMEVRLNLGGEQASVIFTSQHAAVREALAAATPKLTALLADQGIVLQNVQVASDSLQQQQQNAFSQQQARQFDAPDGGTRHGAIANTVGSEMGIERRINLSDLRLPAGSTRVSLFV